MGPSLHLRGTVLPDDVVRDLYVAGGRLWFDEADVEGLDEAVTVFDGGVLVPGLVDAHLSLFSPAGDDADRPTRVRASARAQLAAGVLALREPGSPDDASREIGPGLGLPRTVTAGRLLARTGRYFPGLGREVEPDDLPDAAAEEAARSSAWVKVIADFLEPGGRISPAFPLEALVEAVRRAHDAGARVAAHVACPEAIDDCLTAGVDSLEHATMLRPDQVDRLVEGGTALVPHGLVAGEIARLAAAGLGPLEALGAGSWDARAYLGLPALAPGAPADLVEFTDDAREDLTALERPAVTVLDGVLREV